MMMHRARAFPASARSSQDMDGGGIITLNDVLSLPRSPLDAVITGYDTCHNPVTKVLVDGCCVTTTYSGTGSFESGVHRACLCAADSLGLDQAEIQDIHFYSATELDETARRVLAGHPNSTRPEHIFGNVLDRVPEKYRDDITDTELKFLTLWQDTKNDYKAKNITKASYKQWQANLEREYLCLLIKTFDKVEFSMTSYCFVHGKQCNVSPRAVGRSSWKAGKASMWLEGAGSICCPWSLMSHGNGNRWLDAATLPCMTWLYGLLFYQPDLFIH